jgi:hypothetical protein
MQCNSELERGDSIIQRGEVTPKEDVKYGGVKGTVGA